MPNRFEVISHPNKFRLKPGIWVEPPGTTTTEWPITTTTEEPDVQYVYYDDGIALWRKGVRDGCFVWDKALTPVGFNGIEDTDWENVRTLCPGESSTTTDDGIIQYVIYYDGITLWRKGVRDGCFVWDRAITLTGFDGVEDTDWENVRMLCAGFTTTTEYYDIINYGLLYNWYVIDDIRGIARDGWHIMTNPEMQDLCTYIGGAVTAADKLREAGYWHEDIVGATNDYGFNMRGSSGRNGGVFGGTFFVPELYWFNMWLINPGYFAYCFTSAPDHKINFGNSLNLNYPKYGFSIRLVNDSTSLSPGEEGRYIGTDGKVYRTICIGAIEVLADNLAETLFANGDPIPEVTDDATWAALSTPALCVLNNNWDNV